MRQLFFSKEIFTQIIGAYNQHFNNEDNDRKVEEQVEGKKVQNSIQEDLKEWKRRYQKEWGWYLMAEEVAKFTNSTYFDIMMKPAIEIIGIMMVMRAKVELNK